MNRVPEDATFVVGPGQPGHICWPTLRPHDKPKPSIIRPTASDSTLLHALGHPCWLAVTNPRNYHLVGPTALGSTLK